MYIFVVALLLNIVVGGKRGATDSSARGRVVWPVSPVRSGVEGALSHGCCKGWQERGRDGMGLKITEREHKGRKGTRCNKKGAKG